MVQKKKRDRKTDSGIRCVLYVKKYLETAFLAVCRGLSSRAITVSRSSPATTREYYKSEQICKSGMSLETENFLRGNLLRRNLTKEPEETLKKIMEFQKISGDSMYFMTAADVCRYLAVQTDEEQNVKYYLSAVAYCYLFLAERKNTSEKRQYSMYDFPLILAIRIFNESVAGIFRFLKKQGLLGTSDFCLEGINGLEFFMEKPFFRLSVPPDSVVDFSLCSEHQVKGLRLINRHPGIGTPLVGKVSNAQLSKSLKNPRGLTIPVTFGFRPARRADGKITLQPFFLDTLLSESLQNDETRLLPGSWVLARDFTTPFACFLNDQERRNLLSAMLNPVDQEKISGLYMVEPYQPKKIPVVFIHGLLSSPETWGEMFNSLRNDPQIRERYQFWFYSYSTGFPVLYSADQLRKALLEAQKEFCTSQETTENFGKMVLIGHSMGGLIARTLLQQDPAFLLKAGTGETPEFLKEKLTPEDWKLVSDYLLQVPLPFVHRVIFMAVPHRGAKMAQGRLAQLGITLTKLPETLGKLFLEYQRIWQILYPGRKLFSKEQYFTGISNLHPQNRFVRAISDSPLKEDVVYHSIIGNRLAGNTPGGSDGIVPYSSSHLSSAASECIVKSNHSVHMKPEAIREVLRILLLHLRES